MNMDSLYMGVLQVPEVYRVADPQATFPEAGS